MTDYGHCQRDNCNGNTEINGHADAAVRQREYCERTTDGAARRYDSTLTSAALGVTYDCSRGMLTEINRNVSDGLVVTSPGPMSVEHASDNFASTDYDVSAAVRNVRPRPPTVAQEVLPA